MRAGHDPERFYHCDCIEEGYVSSDKLCEAHGDGQEHALKDIVAWLRRITPETMDDWGLNATREIADALESGRWGTFT